MNKKFFGWIVLFMTSIFFSANAQEIKWPTRTVTFSIPGNAGGGSDLTSRYLTRGWSDSYKANFSMMNLPSTEACFQNIRTKKADGLNIGLAHSALMTQYVTGGSKINPLKDLTVIAAVGNNGLRCIAARVDAPFNTIQEMIDYAKANPNSIKAGTSPNGTVKFLLGTLENVFDIQFRAVEASQETDRLTNLAGGFIDIGTISLSNGRDYEKAGKVKILGTVGADGAVIEDFMSNAPENFKTLQQMGYKNAYAVTSYYVIGPAGLDPKLVEHINQSMKNIGEESSSYIKGMRDMGQVGEWYNVSESKRRYEAELNNTIEVAKKLGMYKAQN